MDDIASLEYNVSHTLERLTGEPLDLSVSKRWIYATNIRGSYDDTHYQTITNGETTF